MIRNPLALVSLLLTCACAPSGEQDDLKAAALAAESISCGGYPQNDPVNGGVTICEQRDFTGLPTAGNVRIETENGDLALHGEGRGNIDLHAFVYARGVTEEQARSVAAEVEIHTADDHFYATGPSESLVPIPGINVNLGRQWYVSFEARLPGQLALDASSISGDVFAENIAGAVMLDSSSGDVTARALSGALDIYSTSGTLTLQGLAGQLVADASNGDIDVDLAGGGWSGGGAEIHSTSGDVTFLVPAGYSATFQLETTSGDIHSDFGGTPDEQPGSEQLTEQVGNGGAQIAARTVSGDIALVRK